MINPELFEPISKDTLSKLKPGEWIWDNKRQARRAHIQSIYNESVVEPIGFRQIHILSLNGFPMYSCRPFMLSSIDNIGFGRGTEWVAFEENRFFRIKQNLEVNDD